MTLAAILLGVALLYRLSLGVDLSDESYYITFLDEWRKAGFGAARSVVLHQTAQFLLYPVAALHAALFGPDGLNLLLRGIYLLLAAAAAASVYLFVRRWSELGVALGAALLVVVFIPFSLPAPSYNTVGMFGTVAALSLFGAWRLRGAGSIGPAILSGLAWMVAVVAYPTLAAALAVLLALLLGAALRERAPRPFMTYTAIAAAWQALGLALVLAAYGPARLAEMLAFSNASMQVSAGVLDKLAGSVARLGAYPGFLALCAAAVLPGLVLAGRRGAASHLLACGLLAALVIGTGLAGPALFFRGHDVVVLLALAGLVVVPVARRGRDEHAGTILIVWATGLAGGLATSATATHGLYNVAIGGLMAAVLVPPLLLPPVPGPATRLAGAALSLLVAGILSAASFAFIYGEPEGLLRPDTRRVRGGVFAGLLTTAARADFLEGAARFLREAGGEAGQVVVLGRLAGIYLLTPMRPATPSTWDFNQFYAELPALAARIATFHARPENRPDLVIVATDRWTRPPGEFGRDLIAGYRPAGTFSGAGITLELFARPAGP